MNTSTCADCGKQVSKDHLAICPHCGSTHPNEPVSEAVLQKQIFIWFDSMTPEAFMTITKEHFRDKVQQLDPRRTMRDTKSFFSLDLSPYLSDELRRYKTLYRDSKAEPLSGKDVKVCLGCIGILVAIVLLITIISACIPFMKDAVREILS